ncbi:alpha/beta hydrolase fold domain-containing protein [Nocardia sp. NPDC056100]|uniref:alpha/beta hydrolase fold domain-containing protein n=1 Tax=Nocardia sp. NPDC056100 TaxID=3345712 RepID=UPI0035D61867
MELDAHTTEFLRRLEESGRTPLHESTPEQARARNAALTALLGGGPRMATVRDTHIDVQGGSIAVRILRPVTDPAGVIVYYHGGGWVIGDLNGFDTLARQVAARTGCTVVLVDYRLAPEYPYPIPVEDSWAALLWVERHRDVLAVDRAPLIVMGDSAGGNLAAVMTQRARDRGGPHIDHQVLIYPITDADFDRASYTAAANQLMVDRAAMAWFFDHYTGDREVRFDPAVSPLRAQDFSGLPSATVLLASHDPLHDEGRAYAAALAAAGVAVRIETAEGQMHGFFHMVGLLPGAQSGLAFVTEQIAGVISARSAVDAVVIGAGFSGLYMLERLLDLGLRVRVVEANDDVGGTWYRNRYPGARCDVESVYYSYGFDAELEQEWTWTERYASQPEIHAYLRHVADRFALREHITFGTTVTAATWDEPSGEWIVHCDSGEVIRCTRLISAAGCLSAARIPDLPGLDDFEGDVVHTAAWPAEDIALSGRRVGVIGTGSTGIQIIPQLAARAERVTVFQRTPHFSAPAGNRPLAADEIARVKREYRAIRAKCRVNPAGTELAKSDTTAAALSPGEHARLLGQKWDAGGPGIIAVFADVLLDRRANHVVASYFRQRIAETVTDPAVAALLTPSGYPIGTKRICVDTGYYETYNRDNVELVSVRDTPIERVTASAVVVDGVDYPVDALVFATGFDAITGPLNRIDIRGRAGSALRDEWAGGPRAYLGVGVAGFPNFFMITGPGSPSVLVNMVTAIEHHVEFIADIVKYQRDKGFRTIEPTTGAQDAWVEHVNAAANLTLYPQAASWYMGANIPGKPRTFMPFVGGMGVFREICDGVVADGYRGFIADLEQPGESETTDATA